jgi:uncharacterized low-complexity protein
MIRKNKEASMRSSLHAATLLALALTVAPIAFAGDEGGEKHSCCAKDAAKTASKDGKCDPKNCPPGKCDKHETAATKAKTTASKTAPKPAA